MIVTNDAYWFLLTGEEPLDEDNYSEAISLAQRFENLPFYEVSIVELLPNGQVEIELLPNIKFTHYFELTKHVRVELCYGEPQVKNGGQVFYRFRNMQTGLCWGHKWEPVTLNSKGKPQFTPNKCIFPLWTEAVKKL